MSDLQFHEAANIFPLDEETIPELAEDIRKNGLVEPIKLCSGKVLDGRRRLKACELVGVKPQFATVNPPDPIAYSWSLNGPRRHLTATQKAMVGARMREMYKKAADDRMKAGKGADGSGGRGHKKNPPVNLPEGLTGDARDLAGKAVGVSGSLIEFATKVLEDGTPKLIAAVDEDLLAASTAAKLALLSESEQDAAVDRAKEKAEAGHKKKPRPSADRAAKEREQEAAQQNGTIKVHGVGVIHASEAINCLRRIPKNDALRDQGFRLVKDWLKRNQ